MDTNEMTDIIFGSRPRWSLEGETTDSLVWSMSTEISPIREDETEDCGLPTTPDHKGSRGGRQRSSALTPIGSPALERPEEKLWHRPHTSSFSFGDPFRSQERPNSAPDRVLGCPPSPGNVFASCDDEILRLTPGKLHPPSPEQATFHPQPQRHQPWVMPLLESEASPGLEGREVNNVNIFGEALKPPRPKPLTGWDENSSAPTPLGTSCGTPALDASTPSPEQGIVEGKEPLESPIAKPRSVQNTPEPSHYYSCGAGISTPSPCAMSSLNHLALPPRLGEGMTSLLGNFDGPAGPMFPPPLPAHGAVPDMGSCGGAPDVPMPPMPDVPMWGMRPQDMTAQQLAVGFHALQWGAPLPWRFSGVPSMPVPLPQEVREPPRQDKENVFSMETISKAETIYPNMTSTRKPKEEGENERIDVSNLPSEAQELVGQVGQMSRTQAGSKFLQRQLQKRSGAAVDVILAEVEDEIAAMMCDSYGNYLCSAAFSACSQKQRKRMLEKLAPRVGQIACDKRGTHALQALIGFLQLEEEQSQLMAAIKSQVIQLSMDPNGTHVVQRLLTCFSPHVVDCIYAVVAEQILEVAFHPYGLCVLKKCISEATVKHADLLLKQLARHTMELVQNPYGNFAIQHALEEWGGRRCQAILQKMEGRVMQLSIQKFSSNVVEKLFSLAPADFRKRFIGELVASEKMSTLVNSTYGHYVVRRALQMATPEQSEALIKAVRANLEMLPSKRLWVKWENVISGQADWEGEHLKGPKPRSKKREQYPQFSR